MRSVRLPALLALAALGLVAVTARATQDPPEGMSPEAMAQAMELAQPGPEHELLAKHAGEWTVEASLAMAPGTEPFTEKGTARMHPILGGRFLQIDVQGAFMGMPFESMTLMGFDRRYGDWTLIGFDTYGTYYVTAKGKRGEDGVVRMDGRDEDLTGPQLYTFVVEFVSDDELVVSTDFTAFAGQTFEEPFRMVSVRYKRK